MFEIQMNEEEKYLLRGTPVIIITWTSIIEALQSAVKG